jgi:hypothetical protein
VVKVIFASSIYKIINMYIQVGLMKLEFFSYYLQVVNMMELVTLLNGGPMNQLMPLLMKLSVMLINMTITSLKNSIHILERRMPM